MEAEPPPARPRGKNPVLVLISVVALAMLFIAALASRSWAPAAISATIWALSFWWLLHGLIFQIGATVTAPKRRKKGSADIPLVILYMTCDDFLPECLRSCIDQDYPTDRVRVLICDDSRDGTHVGRIDRFVEGMNPEIRSRSRLLRRQGRGGFKAGNMNHAIREWLLPGEEWVVIVDADQTLPGDYLTSLAPILAEQPMNVAFVQAGHVAHNVPSQPATGGPTPRRATRIQEVMSWDVRIFYERDLPLRERYGFMPFLGHGAAIRRSAWEVAGAFPEVVSEDYAFAMSLASMGMRGVYAEGVRSEESFPKDFDSFQIRLRKFAGGTAELLRYEVPTFLRSRASLVEKYDLMMQLMWFPLSALMVLNGFLSAYIGYQFQAGPILPLHPALPYFYTFLFVAPILVLVTAAPGPMAAIRYWFWAAAIYMSGLPISAWHFLAHLGCRPVFLRTPKGDDRATVSVWSRLGMAAIGAAALTCAWRWWSPFSPVLAAQGSAYIGSLLFRWLNESSPIGSLARLVAWIPGGLMLASLYTMWSWSVH